MIRHILLALVTLLFVVLVINALLGVEGDFLVYHRTGAHLLAGEPIYFVARDGGFCFKYPPWMAVPLLPFGALPLRVASLLWRLLIVASLVWIWRWTARNTQHPVAAAIALPLFWGIWVQNVVTGQMTIPLLALALWGFERSGRFVLFTSLSAKVFHLFAWLGLPEIRIPRRALLNLAVTLALLSIPALWGYREAGFGAFTDMIHHYVTAMGSNTDRDLGGGLYGLPTLWSKLFGLDPNLTSSKLIGLIPSFAVAAVILFGLRRKMSGIHPRALFAAALALAAAIHPLTFVYAFAWMYPVTAIALSGAMTSETRRSARALVVAAILCLVFLNSKFSAWLGIHLFDGYPIKAIGALLMSASLLLMSERSLRPHEAARSDAFRPEKIRPKHRRFFR